jgi:hypothetical protein
MTLRSLLPTVGLLAAALAGCGGGGGGGEEDAPAASPGASIPADATQSASAFTEYLLTLKPNDTGEPLNVSGLKPPVSNTDEAVDIP